MSASVRGPATGRFYRAFHAWSRLGSVSHQQRRCFVPTASLYDVKDDQPRTSGSTPAKHGGHAILLSIPQARLERLQQHPTYLQKMYAGVNATIEPRGPPTADGWRVVCIEAPNSKTCSYVRQILVRRADDLQTLDNTVFHMDRKLLRNRTIEITMSLSPERASLLEDNANELKLRIEKTFSVRINLSSQPKGPANDGVRQIVVITGRHPDANAAKVFIRSLGVELEQSTKVKEQQAHRPTSTLPKSSSVSLQSKKEPTTIQLTYKHTMRSVPSSVVVLTTKVSSSASDINLFRGMTVSSLTSVTLEPEPIISFSIRGPSRTLDCITAGQPFAVNFLNGDPKGALIADIFSKPHDHPSQPFRTIKALSLVTIYAKDNDPAPPALGGGLVPARFTCELLPGKSLEIGDHTVIFARITDVYRSQKFQNAQSDLPTFLTYAQAGYRTLAPKPISLPTSKAPKSVQSEKSAPSPSEASTLQPQQTEAELQETELFDEAFPEQTTKSDATDDVVDAYWRMALDEDERDSVLEERAADQRALGEAEKPDDHPIAGVQDDLLDRPPPKNQDN